MLDYYEIWRGASGRWLIYKVSNDGQHYVCIKSYATKKGAENWANKQWRKVVWR